MPSTTLNTTLWTAKTPNRVPKPTNFGPTSPQAPQISDNSVTVDPEGNTWWEGNPNVKLSPFNFISFQLLPHPQSHSKPASSLAGAIQAIFGTETISYPCYVTPEDQKQVDFYNGTVCYRLYTCSTVTHVVANTIISSARVNVTMQSAPYSALGGGMRQNMAAANGQIAQSTISWQTTHTEGNYITFEASVEMNGPYNLFWTVSNLDFSIRITNDIGSFYAQNDHDYSDHEDVEIPQSASVVACVGLDHTAYSKISWW
jgi:hypothetical protein